MDRCHAYFDSKCEELARHFLADASEGFTQAEALDLAGEIQNAVENWWVYRKPPVTEWLDPNLSAPSNPLKASSVSAGTLITMPNSSSSLVIRGAAGESIFTIRCDGRVEINPSVTLDEAARGFWDAVIRLNPQGGDHA